MRNVLQVRSHLYQKIQDYQSAAKATKVEFYACPQNVQFSAPEQKLTDFAYLIK